MFHTERTEIKPCFGLSLEEVMNIIRAFDATSFNPHMPSMLYEITGLETVRQLITVNPFAIKLLEQKPELVAPEALHMNHSGDVIDLVYNYRSCVGNDVLSKLESPILDTYLPRLQRHQLHARVLSRNPRAIPFLTKNPDLICWPILCENPEALDLLEANPENISYNHLSRNTNPRAIAILRENFDKIEWAALSGNSSPAAVELLLENHHKINWYTFSQNTCPLAFPLMEENISNLNSYFLSTNPHAVGFLKANPKKVYWPSLCFSASTREQFEFIRENLDKVDWGALCRNPSKRALSLLTEFPERIQWHFSLGNQDVFETTVEYNYSGIREAKRNLHEEFHAWAGHPSKMSTKWKDWGLEGAVDEEEDSSFKW